MLKNIKITGLATILSCVLACFSLLEAKLIYYESFDSKPTTWKAEVPKPLRAKKPFGQLKRLSSSLQHPDVLSSGGSLALLPNEKASPLISSQLLPGGFDQGPLWVSFLVKVSSADSGQFFLGLKESDRNYDLYRMGKKPGNLVSISNDSGHLKQQFPVGKVVRCVVRYDLKPGNDLACAWINPDTKTQPLPKNSVTWIRHHDFGSVDQISISCRAPSKAPLLIDEIRVGTTWESINELPARNPTGQFLFHSRGVTKNFTFYLKTDQPIKTLTQKSFNLTNCRLDRIGQQNSYTKLDFTALKSGNIKVAPANNGILTYDKRSVKIEPLEATADVNKPSYFGFKYHGHQSHKIKKNRDQCFIWTSKKSALIIDDIDNEDFYQVVGIQRFLHSVDLMLGWFEKNTGLELESRGAYQGKFPIKISRQIDKVGKPNLYGGLHIPLKDFRALIPKLVHRNYYYSPELLFSITQNFDWRPSLRSINYTPFRNTPRRNWWSNAFARTHIALMLKEYRYYQAPIFQRDLAHASDIKRVFFQIKKPKWFSIYNHAQLNHTTEKLFLDDLLSAFFLHWHTNFGNKVALRKFHDILKNQTPLDSPIHRGKARDNFVLAASKASSKDLGEYFRNQLFWPVSDPAQEQLAGRSLILPIEARR